MLSVSFLTFIFDFEQKTHMPDVLWPRLSTENLPNCMKEGNFFRRLTTGQSHLRSLDTKKTLNVSRPLAKTVSITIISGNGEGHGNVCNVF
ncbi:MAG: hypothetical protein HW380_2759 [Magnetococcales bacterium]|nr:hypothetical protein [Magnetococcales bacterium]